MFIIFCVGGNEDKVVFSFGCNILICIEVLVDEVFYDKFFLCDGKIIVVLSLLIGINYNDKFLVGNVFIIEGYDFGDVMSYDILLLVLNFLLLINMFRKDLGLLKEKDGNFMIDYKKYRFVEELNGVMFLENLFLMFRLFVIVYKDVWFKEEEVDNVLCYNGIEFMICKDVCIVISFIFGMS